MKEHEIVVHLSGYSVARQGIVEEYGTGYDGKLLTQKPYRIGMSHEGNNALQKARKQRADVFKFGHWHASSLAIDKAGHNQGRFIDEIPTTQRVTSTELAIGGLPRTAGVELKIYSQPGRYFKLFIPMEHMRRIGLAWLQAQVEQAVKDGKKPPTPKKG